ncbi:MAG TPA: small ribosomal subunit Rsm22 family protein [Terriglobales bacterium]|nr:small ribosomal subunit Rsm22 family protein [Terriglobales bacterium]
MSFPPILKDAIERELAPLELAKVARAASHLTSGYKFGTATLNTPEERLAYLATRLPATFAADLHVFHEIARITPEWNPTSILDLGAGPGTATWAACEIWPAIRHATLVESNAPMIDTGKRLASEHSVLQEATWVHTNMERASYPPVELVVLSYSLGEMPDPILVVQNALAAAKGLLVIIEPGTPRHFQTLARIRRELIAAGAHLVAPCPHQDECPMWEADDWCHFAARLERSALHRRLKGGDLGYEDEKFSYLVFGKSPVPRAASRIVRHPETRSGFIRLQLCTPSGLQQQTVTRSQKSAFRAARRSKWGDAWNQFE